MRPVTVGLVLAMLWIVTATVAAAEEQDEKAEKTDKPTGTTQRYTHRKPHDPNGIGKFYFDREIARVMGHQAINWLERPEREQEERLTLMVENLQLEPGMAVADIGAGSGVISAMIADRIGADGVVYAVDIQQEMLDALADRCKKSGIANVRPIRGTVKTPKLTPESLDLAIMVNVYHEFNFPYEMLLEISKALKPGGRVVFVEFRKEDPQLQIKEVHKMSEAQVKLEAGLPEFGLEWKETIDKLPVQHMIVFQRKPAE